MDAGVPILLPTATNITVIVVAMTIIMEIGIAIPHMIAEIVDGRIEMNGEVGKILMAEYDPLFITATPSRKLSTILITLRLSVEDVGTFTKMVDMTGEACRQLPVIDAVAVVL